ncbi:MAG TPA: hypothetical protein VM802_16415 [Chitinophaga sp.]|uniref:hypothetical protein n=1 Tax=Chitinophaga sp. TaxID=1869181 RepID=UPI002BEA2FD6|nr:hypothetical protein [Chitinophaga sp.]HVI46461.1 hypothetical protein [Chitinophaga sp.]
MQKDYILEMVEELGQVLGAILTLKKNNPRKALEYIQVAFRSTKFKNKDFFDSLDVKGLKEFIDQNSIDHRTIDSITDLLLEELDIKISNSSIDDVELLVSKVEFLILYCEQKENELKIFSFKRNIHRERLKELLAKLPI